MYNKDELEKLKEEFETISNELLEKTVEIPSDSENSETDSGKQQVPVLSTESKRAWQDLNDKIIRRFNRFNSDMRFIVTIGMLKAGKSTLVNILTRNTNASPIGFGVDTTLRPALIMASKDKNEVGIYRYKDVSSSTDQQEGERSKKIGEILDRISGIKPWDDDVKKPSPLNLDQKNLQKILCQESGSQNELPEEPLLVVVVVPANEESLINEHCVIFDMPGLDSNNSSISSADYKKIIKECTLVLFVQSNIAPLNKEACDVLNDIGNNLDARTYRLVQNRMNAKYWRKSDIINKELLEQRQKGKREFVKYINSKTKKIEEGELSVLSANFGMAYDAIFLQQEDLDEKYQINNLLDESEYKTLEDNLREDINKDMHHYVSSRDHLKDQLYTTKDDVMKIIEKINNQIGEKDKNIKDIRESINIIADYPSKFHKRNIPGESLYLTFKLTEEIKKELEHIFTDTENNSSNKEITECIKYQKDFEYDTVNKFFDDLDRNAHNAMIELIKKTVFDNIEYSIEGQAEKMNGRDILNHVLKNVQVSPNSETLKAFFDNEMEKGLFSPNYETLNPFFNNEMEKDLEELKLKRPDKKRGLKAWLNSRLRKKTVVDSKDINEDILKGYRKDAIRHYNEKIQSVLNRHMKTMMENKLKNHTEKLLKNELNTKKQELAKAEKENKRLRAEKEAFEKVMTGIDTLATKVGGLKI